ncbi:hypothetical protein JVU11DRAFT_7349 [Chiua virens]|nr:hypothetical protein JVU11DRAFT_7349 [Chiua virens]
MTLTAHCIGDVTAMNSFARCFLDLLAQVPLEDRLAMVVPMAEREHVQLRVQSPARRRWQKVANVILQSRMGKPQGGHALPWRITPSTSFTATRSRPCEHYRPRRDCCGVGQLSSTQSHVWKCVLCTHTSGHDPVALPTVLAWGYIRGRMGVSKERAAYHCRSVQPPSVSRQGMFWKGGSGESTPSIGTLLKRLPFIPLGETEGRYQPHGQNLGLSDGAPPVSEFLTFGQFLHRMDLVKKQADAIFHHPLFFELAYTWNATVEILFRQTTLQLLEPIEASKDGEDEDESDSEVLKVMVIPVTLAHEGFSFSNLDSILLLKYPLPPTHPLSPFSSIPHPSKAGYLAPLSSSALSGSATTVASCTASTASRIQIDDWICLLVMLTMSRGRGRGMDGRN